MRRFTVFLFISVFFMSLSWSLGADQSAMTWFFNAQLHLESGEKDKAVTCLRKALEMDSGFEKARELLKELGADSNVAVTEPREPAQNKKRTGKSRSGSASRKSTLSKANDAARAGRFREAIDGYREALKEDPKLVDARSNLGYCLEKLGMYTDAIKEYKRILVIKGDSPLVNNNLGFLYARSSNDLNAALDHCSRALKAEPGNLDFKDSLGYVYFRQGALEQAAAIFQEVLEKKPSMTSAARHLAMVRYMSGKVEDAKNILARVVSENPQDFDGFLELGKLYVDTGEADKALEVLEKALALRPESVETSFYLGFTYLSKDPAKAIQYLRTSADSGIEMGVVPMAEAFILQQNQNITQEDAVKIPGLLKKSVKLAPDWWIPRYFLADWYVNMKSREEAIAMAQEALKVAPPLAKTRVEGLLESAKAIEVGQSYKNEVHGFSVNYPSDWEMSEDTKQFNIPQAQVIFYKKDQESGRVALTAIIIQPNVQEFTLDDIIESKRQQLSSMPAGYNEVFAKPVSYPNFEGSALCYEQGGAMKILQVFATIDKRILAIAMIDRKEGFDSLEQQREMILRSFKLNY
jgi:tetratricopeptide (TPR) repeat protein